MIDFVHKNFYKRKIKYLAIESKCLRWYNMDKPKETEIKKVKEDDSMSAAMVKRIDKTDMIGLTMDKKKILKSLQGIASSPIDFNKIRNEQKYGKDRL